MTDEILKKSHVHPENIYVPKICPNCKGHGDVLLDHTTTGGHLKITCNVCRGSGEL